MFNYGKSSAKPFGVPRTESVHGWSKTHKSKPDYKSKSKSEYKFKSKSKSNFEYNYKSNYWQNMLGMPRIGWSPFADKSKSNYKSVFIYKKSK